MRGNVILADDFDVTRDHGPSFADNGEMFNAEEMQAIREQYEERLAAEAEKREELEWQVQRALATMRDAEEDARRAADQMRKVHLALAEMIKKPEPELAPVVVAPRAPVAAPAAKLQPAAKVAPKRAAPPPIPAAAQSAPIPGNRRGPLPPRSLNGYKKNVSIDLVNLASALGSR
jgi:hypothetical protein